MHQGRLSENVQMIWQKIDPLTKDTLVGDSIILNSICINVSQFHNVMCVLFRLAGTGSIQDAALYAATTVAGAGLTKISASASGSTEATQLMATAKGSNAAGTLGARGVGMIVLETSATEIANTLANADFVTARASFAAPTDELGVLWVLSNPRYPRAGLTSTGRGSTA
jgi:hypothetical protein